MKGILKDMKDQLLIIEEEQEEKDPKVDEKTSISVTIRITRSAPRGIKTLALLTLILTITTIFIIAHDVLQEHMTRFLKERNWYALTESPCYQPEEHLQEMATLAIDASKALQQLGAHPVACYGTLLGALRKGSVLPWDNNVDLCIVDEISDFDFETVQDEFYKYNIMIHPYDSWYGHFRFRRNGFEGFVTVFSACSIVDKMRFSFKTKNAHIASWEEMENKWLQEDNWLCPHGRLPYITQLLKRQTRPIPRSLLNEPLASIPFGKNASITIPNKDVAIVKFFYPESWWRVIKPIGCT